MSPQPEDQLAQIREAIGRLFDRMRRFEERLDRLEEVTGAGRAEDASAEPPPPLEVEALAEEQPPQEPEPAPVVQREAEAPPTVESAAEAASEAQDQIEPQPAEKPRPPAEAPPAEEVPKEEVTAKSGRHWLRNLPGLPEEAELPSVASIRAKLAGLNWEQLVGKHVLTWAGAITSIVAIAFAIHWVWKTYEVPWLKSGSFHLLGLGFLAAAHFLYRRGTKLLAEALAGLGIFTLYGIAFAGQLLFDRPLYGQWTTTITFLEGGLITLAAVAIAVRVPSVTVVLLGALGGYLTPLVVASDEPQHVVLFTYLAFLNVTLITSAVLRRWSFLKPLTLAATAAMFLLWIGGPYYQQYRADLRWSTEWLVVLHAGIFLLGSTIPPLAWKRPSTRFDLTALSTGSLWMMGMTWRLFKDYPHQQLALVSWGLAALHLALFAATYSRVTNVDRMPRIHLALAAIFFTLAAPLQLDDNSYLSVAWASEGLIFALVGLYFSDRQMYVSSLIVFLLTAGHLLGWVMPSEEEYFTRWSIDSRFFIFTCAGFLALMAGCAYRWLPAVLERTAGRWERYLSIGLLVGGNLALLLGIPLQWHESRMVLALWMIDVAFVWAAGFAARSPLARYYALLLGVVFAAPRLWWHGLDDPEAYQLLLNSRYATLTLAGTVLAVFGWLYSRLPSRRAKSVEDAAADLDLEERSLHVVLGPLGHALLLAAIVCEINSWISLHWAPLPSRETFIMTSCTLAATLYGCALLAGGMALRYMLYRVLALAVGIAVLAKATAVDSNLAGYPVSSWNLDVRFLLGGTCAVIVGLLASSYLLPALRRRKIFSEKEIPVAMAIVAMANAAFLFLMTCQWESRLVLALWTLDVALVWALGFWRDQLYVRLYALILATAFMGSRLLWHGLVDPDPYRILLNSRFATLAFAGAVLAVFGWLYSRLPRRQQEPIKDAFSAISDADFEERSIHRALSPLGHALLLTAILCEVNSGILLHYAELPGRETLVMTGCTLATALYVAALLCGGMALRYTLYRLLAFVLAGGVLIKAAAVDYLLTSFRISSGNLDIRFLLGEMSMAVSALGAASYLLPALQRRKIFGKTEFALAMGLLGLINIVALHVMTCQWDSRLVLLLWTLDAAAIWALGFWRNRPLVRLYVAGLALVMVGGRALCEGAEVGGTYHLLVNDRFGTLALVAVLYFAAGWAYRHCGANFLRAGHAAEETWQGADLAKLEKSLDPVLGVLANAMLVIALSLEIHTWFDVAIAEGRTPFPDMEMARQAAYSILWAVYAAVVVAAGFAMRYRLFRWLGLIAFAPILLKVFFVDLAWLELLPRVLALAVLGAMLLGVSLLYQRFAQRLEDQASQ